MTLFVFGLRQKILWFLKLIWDEYIHSSGFGGQSGQSGQQGQSVSQSEHLSVSQYILVHIRSLKVDSDQSKACSINSELYVGRMGGLDWDGYHLLTREESQNFYTK